MPGFTKATSWYFAHTHLMEVEEHENGAPGPRWRELFEKVFGGASTRLKNDRGWRSLLGFDEEVIDGLWTKYGSKCKHGDSPLQPKHWLWFFSYLKLPGTWINVAFMWRKPCTTFTTVVNEIVWQLEEMVDEVRAKTNVSDCVAAVSDPNLLKQVDFLECYDDLPTDGPFEELAYVVDGIELEIARPNSKEEEDACFSHKPKMCAVKYEGTYAQFNFPSIKTEN